MRVSTPDAKIFEDDDRDRQLDEFGANHSSVTGP